MFSKNAISKKESSSGINLKNKEQKKSTATTYKKPPVNILKEYENKRIETNSDYETTQKEIISSFASFGINITPLDIIVGPTVSRYEFQIPSGISISKVSSLETDISYALGGRRVRILAPVYGKKANGVEVANNNKGIVSFKNELNSLDCEIINEMRIPFILGKSIEGDTKYIDISKLPHLIIAGTTGSGKSVCLNSLINSVLYTKTPDEVKMILVDPKIVELSIYNGIPHLLCPTITEPVLVAEIMKWLISEMEKRYLILNEYQERNIDDLNNLIEK